MTCALQGNKGHPEMFSTHAQVAFSHCASASELWVALIEKAYAKLHTCYEGIESGKVRMHTAYL
jgi:hypothetical protein